jgi:acetyl-CoA carboxylase biotin carboxyl carrier protein
MHHLNVKELAAWLEASDLDELALTGPQVHIRLQRAASAPAPLPAKNPAGEVAAPIRHEELKSPGLGIFLHSAPLRSHRFVQTGDAVAPGQCVGLLQIGGLLTPVRAGCHGVMVAYLQPHGSTVGYGTPLLSIDPL